MERLYLLGVYTIFFAILHSLTASEWFKVKAYKKIKPDRFRLLYSAFSVFTVLPILVLWRIERSVSPLIYSVPAPLAFFFFLPLLLGLALVLWTFIYIDALSFVGLTRPKKRSSELITTGPYAITRHPLYLGGVMILWSNPVMRVVDILVISLFTTYFILGGVLEERKLTDEFGIEYINYKEEVSMLIPVKWLLKKIR